MTVMRTLSAIFGMVVMLGACASSGSGPSASSGARSANTVATTTTAQRLVDTPCGPLPEYPAPWAQRPRYQVQLRVDVAARRVEGEMDVRFTPDAPTDRLVFRLWANAPRLGRAGGRIDVTSARLDGVDIAGTYEPGNAGPGTPGSIFTLTAGRVLKAGKSIDAHLTFTITMPRAVNDRVTQIGTNVRLGSALPMLSWVRGEGWQTSPAVDAFAEAAASEVADYDVTVQAPSGHTVLATGEEREPGRFVAEAVRDWGATIGKLRLASVTAQGGATEVVAGVGEGAADNPPDIAARAAAALDAMSEHFGPYPYDRLTVVVTPELSGGIELPQHILLGAGVSKEHLVHEVAHQWFYGIVGNDQYRDPWLDEGLAKYADARIDNRLVAELAVAIPQVGRGRLGESMAYWQANLGAYFRSVYVQGAQVMAHLGDSVGSRDSIDCALRRYVHENAYRIARPTDLVAAIRAQIGPVITDDLLAPLGATGGS